MTGAQLNFNATNVPTQKAFDPLPSGWYNAKITDSGIEPTKTPGGQMLKLQLEVLDGPYAGRKVFDRLNIVNANPTAVQIGYETLSTICHAVGVLNIQQSSAELHNLPLKVKVKLKNAETTAEGKTYDAGNEVKGYDHINSDHPLVQAPVGGIAGAPVGQPVWATGGPVAAPAPAAVPAPAVAPPVAFAPPVAAQPWAQGAPAAAAAPVAAPPPPFVAPPPPPAPVVPERIMLPAAGGASYESFIAQGWTDDAMIAQGYMAMQAPAPAAPPAPPAPPAGVPAATPGAVTPPWQR